MLKLCDDEHPTIAHDEFACPICGILQEMQDELDDANAAIDELKQRISELEQDINASYEEKDETYPD